MDSGIYYIVYDIGGVMFNNGYFVFNDNEK
jgi:hypothetical protein